MPNAMVLIHRNLPAATVCGSSSLQGPGREPSLSLCIFAEASWEGPNVQMTYMFNPLDKQVLNLVANRTEADKMPGV